PRRPDPHRNAGRSHAVPLGVPADGSGARRLIATGWRRTSRPCPRDRWGRGGYVADMEPITTAPALAEPRNRTAKHPFVTLDTEVLRESTYYPIVCVTQMASVDEAFVIDALAKTIDLQPFYKLMANESVVKVFHAARQDIEIVWHRAGMIPHPIFDTQVAAMVLGYGASISYEQLVQRVTGHSLGESPRSTDWTPRPLA